MYHTSPPPLPSSFFSPGKENNKKKNIISASNATYYVQETPKVRRILKDFPTMLDPDRLVGHSKRRRGSNHVILRARQWAGLSLQWQDPGPDI